MKDERTENRLATVPQGEARQAKDTTPRRWSWVERSVWTEGMLKALEKGVKGGRWYSLIDKVWNADNLMSAWLGVLQNDGSAGVDKQTVEQFQTKYREEVEGLSQEIREGRYRPYPVRRVYIPKLGSREKRPLGIPAVRDRVVQGAVRGVIEPILERAFAEHSYGFRPGRGCKDALRRVEGFLRQGFSWVVDADLKSYFDTIPHDRLLGKVEELISDGRVLQLLEQFLKQGVMEELRDWEPTEQGTPQGAVISPLLANLYLNELDHQMAQAGWEMTRYADDFIIQCRSKAQAEQALAMVRAWVEAAGLKLHPEKTRIVDATQPGGFDFLGYHFERGMKWPRKKSLHKLKETIRQQTKRTNGNDLGTIIRGLNRTLRGWFEYFKHSKHTTFGTLDGWIRMRLRSLLKKRRKGRGVARTRADHTRWPNAFFDAAGLFSLEAAHAAILQSR